MAKNRKPLQLSQALDEGLDQAARELSGLTGLVETIEEASEKSVMTPAPRPSMIVKETVIHQREVKLDQAEKRPIETIAIPGSEAILAGKPAENEQLLTDGATEEGQGATKKKRQPESRVPTSDELNRLRDLISNLKFKIDGRTPNPFPSRTRQVTSRQDHQGRGRPMVAGSVSPSAALAVDLFAVMMDIPVSHVLETMIMEFVKANPGLFAKAIEVWIFRRMAQAA
jgi:hypothetical protein